jgi:hypothetical protein
MSMDFEKMTRRFLLGEAFESPDVFGYIQSLQEILNRLQPKTIRETRYLAIAKNHIIEIRRFSRRLAEDNKKLQEQIKILEENKEGK